MGQVDVLLTPGHHHNLVDLLGQNPVQCFFWAGRQVGQALSLTGPLLPANDAAMCDHQDRTTAPRRTPWFWEVSIT